jgi:hypothetical protein
MPSRREPFAPALFAGDKVPKADEGATYDKDEIQ